VDAGTLPLVLLAAVGLPDLAVRRRLAGRLDEAIEKGRPPHTVRELRQLLQRRHGPRKQRFTLDEDLRETAVRVLRLAFSERSDRRHDWVRITAAADPMPGEGLLINGELQVRTTPGRHQEHTRCHFRAGEAGARLARFGGPPRIQATCRVETGFVVDLLGDLPWRLGQDVLARGRLGRSGGLGGLGFTGEHGLRRYTLRPATAEATILFSACLARGERLVLRGPQFEGRGYVVVALRDFDGDEAALPARVSLQERERWLFGVPVPPLELDAEDRLAIARWAYLPSSWEEDELVERLL
jgi:hypothetical protein